MLTIIYTLDLLLALTLLWLAVTLRPGPAKIRTPMKTPVYEFWPIPYDEMLEWKLSMEYYKTKQ